MKKGLSLLLALMLMLGCAAALADTPGDVAPSDADEEIVAKMPEPGWVLDSVKGAAIWQDDRATLEVFLEDVDNYKVQITWASSASETTEWVYACQYVPESQELRAVRVVCDDVTYNEKGDETRKPRYEKESEAVFRLNAEGRLALEKAGDEALEGKTFELVNVALWSIPEKAELTEDAQAAFGKATETLMGVNYQPIALLAETDGAYCVLAKATVVYPGAEPYYVLFYATKDGQVQNIYELWLDQHSIPSN